MAKPSPVPSSLDEVTDAEGLPLLVGLLQHRKDTGPVPALQCRVGSFLQGEGRGGGAVWEAVRGAVPVLVPQRRAYEGNM